jgi:hypothetical protein
MNLDDIQPVRLCLFTVMAIPLRDGPTPGCFGFIHNGDVVQSRVMLASNMAISANDAHICPHNLQENEDIPYEVRLLITHYRSLVRVIPYFLKILVAQGIN